MGAHILWALDSTKEYQSLSPRLLDHLAVEVGLRNLHYLSAVLSDNEPTYLTFREAGYTPCAWQKVWQLKETMPTVNLDKGILWRRVKLSDTLSISLLQNRLLSAQEKRITSPIEKKPPQFILINNDSVCGYAYAISSFDKALITPFFDPNSINTAQAIAALLDHFFRGVRTIYLLQTSSQDWINTSIHTQVYLVGSKKELLVKYLSVLNEDRILNRNQAKTSRHPDIVSPLTKISDNEDNI